MSQSGDLTCEACKMPPYPADAPLDATSGLPAGWVVRRINGRAYTLCDCCGSIRHFKGGVSTICRSTSAYPSTLNASSVMTKAAGCIATA